MWNKLKRLLLNVYVKMSPRAECIIVNEIISPDGSLGFELVWNKKFIKTLQEHGYLGESEEDIIQQYITNLMHEIVARNGQGVQQ